MSNTTAPPPSMSNTTALIYMMKALDDMHKLTSSEAVLKRFAEKSKYGDETSYERFKRVMTGDSEEKELVKSTLVNIGLFFAYQYKKELDTISSKI